MTNKVTKLYLAAKEDLIFRYDLKIHERKDSFNNTFLDNTDKMILATVYMGYLIGKGIYNENDYELL